MNNATTATVRTTWNGTIVAALIVATAAIFGWDVNLDDLAPFLPVIGIFIGVFYRASLWAAAKWPSLGYVLFGKPATPAYPPPQPDV